MAHISQNNITLSYATPINIALPKALVKASGFERTLLLWAIKERFFILKDIPNVFTTGGLLSIYKLRHLRIEYSVSYFLHFIRFLVTADELISADNSGIEHTTGAEVIPN